METQSLETELSNRSRRAYRALHEAERARQDLAETEYDGLPAEAAAEACNVQGDALEAIFRLTGSKSRNLDVVEGEELAAARVPHDVEDLRMARDMAVRLRNAGLTALRRVERAVDETHIEAGSNAHRTLRGHATTMIGNAEALRDAISEDFERDIERLQDVDE